MTYQFNPLSRKLDQLIIQVQHIGEDSPNVFVKQYLKQANELMNRALLLQKDMELRSAKYQRRG